MRIIFLAKKTNSASYIFYKSCISELKELDPSVKITFKKISDQYEYKHFDIAIFMGGAIDSFNAKKNNPNIKCVVIDSRSGHYDRIDFTDLLISNGIENYLFNLNNKYKNFIYPTYPKIDYKNKNSKNNKNLIIGYHGNKIHLEAMYPRITDALKNINKSNKIELFAMYNVKGLGESKIVNSNKLGFTVKHIQYSHENYIKYLSKADIGIVPQLIPTKDNFFIRYLETSNFNKYNQSYNDYKLRFKDTTNLGRHFIFCQLRIPFISDITPSSCIFVKNEINGFLSHSTSNWEYYIKLLISDTELRKKTAQKAYDDWKETYSHDKLNIKLLDVLKKL